MIKQKKRLKSKDLVCILEMVLSDNFNTMPKLYLKDKKRD